jgi:hypothetical protein
MSEWIEPVILEVLYFMKEKHLKYNAGAKGVDQW